MNIYALIFIQLCIEGSRMIVGKNMTAIDLFKIHHYRTTSFGGWWTSRYLLSGCNDLMEQFESVFIKLARSMLNL